jgi:hypothetical protein
MLFDCLAVATAPRRQVESAILSDIRHNGYAHTTKRHGAKHGLRTYESRSPATGTADAHHQAWKAG